MAHLVPGGTQYIEKLNNSLVELLAHQYCMVKVLLLLLLQLFRRTNLGFIQLGFRLMCGLRHNHTVGCGQDHSLRELCKKSINTSIECYFKQTQRWNFAAFSELKLRPHSILFLHALFFSTVTLKSVSAE